MPGKEQGLRPATLIQSGHWTCKHRPIRLLGLVHDYCWKRCHRRSAWPPSHEGVCPHASIRLTVAIPYHCHFGQHLRLVGSTEHLGRWDADQGVVMRWSDGDLWSVDVDLPVEWGTELQYKYVVRSEDGSTTWKPGCNFSLCIPTDEADGWLPGSIAVKDAWDDSTRLIKVGVREGENDETIVRLSVERAMKVLDMAMGQAYGLQEDSIDPSAPERLAADRAVAAAARHAIALTKALKGPGNSSPTSARLLGPGGT